MEKGKKLKSTALAKIILEQLIKQDIITGFVCVKDIPDFVTDDLSKIIENKIGEVGLVD